jgi:exopolyphosphatase/guanosine-5'-triphosphate,3'-diphosphate pyrophosphatase
MRIAVVDAGSNSFILLIAERKQGKINYILDLSKVVGMGRMKDENDGTFEQAKDTINEYLKICDEYHVDKRVIVGTEIFRKILPEYFEKLSQKFDDARILSGEEEAELSYFSVIEDENIPCTSPLVVDIGGGSVEYSFMKENALFSRSVPIGALVLTSKFVNSYPIQEQLEDAKIILRKKLNFLPPLQLVSIGGTGTTVASILKNAPFSPEIDGTYISLEKIEELYRKMLSMSLDELSSLVGMEKGREKIIAAGILILLESAKTSSNEGIYVSVRGHRYALAKRILESER